MEMGDDEIAVMGLPVERHHRQHHPGHPTQHKTREEAKQIEHGQ